MDQPSLIHLFVSLSDSYCLLRSVKLIYSRGSCSGSSNRNGESLSIFLLMLLTAFQLFLLDAINYQKVTMHPENRFIQENLHSFGNMFKLMAGVSL